MFSRCWPPSSSTRLEPASGGASQVSSGAGSGGFYLLRPKEMFGLRRRHARVPGPLSLVSDDVAVLTVLDPKNRAAMGRLQVRAVRDSCSICWLQWLVQDLAPDDLLWGAGANTFSRLLASALSALRLENLRITAASLRAGGATHLLTINVPITTIKFYGGWSNDRTMAAYLQEAEGAAALLDVCPQAAAQLLALLSTYGPCRWPPQRSLAELTQWTPGQSSRP